MYLDWPRLKFETIQPNSLIHLIYMLKSYIQMTLTHRRLVNAMQ